jgi:cytochrome P450
VNKTSLPPGFSSPLWLQKLHYTLRPLGYMDAAAKQFGDIFNAPVIGNYPVILWVSNPQAIQQIFSNEAKQLGAPPNQLLQPIVGNGSIFGMEGTRHRRERRLLMPPFHGERMQSYGHLICDLADRSIHALPLNQPFSARERMQDVSLEVILRVVFGIAEGEQFTQLKSLLVQMTDLFQAPWIGGLLFFPSLQQDWGTRSPWGYFRSIQRQVSELLYAEIRDRRQRETLGSDILSLMIAATDEAGESMTDAELHDELITLLLAGHETTATAIAWALYWVHRHPAVLEKLHSEIGSLEGKIDPKTIAQLPYLTAVCYETLRISPVAALTFPRDVKEPVELMGYALEPGMRLYGCIYLTHRRPDLYPEPDQFLPERFLERQFSSAEFLPFGGGMRRCIGEVLALFEMKLVVATLLSRYRFTLASSAPEYPQRRGVILAPAHGVQMQVQAKLGS